MTHRHLVGIHTTQAAGRGMRGDPCERMFTTVKELLWRQRQIQPFPCNKDDVLLSLLPPEMQDWTVGPSKNSEVSVEWMNLSSCIGTGMTATVEFDGETGKAFWMRFDSRVPIPINSSAFDMPPDNLHYGTLTRWWKRANVIHEELKLYQQALWDFLQRANHPKLVEKYWAELHPFVNFELHAGNLTKSPDLNKRRMMPVPPEEDRTGIIETLAASTLLPVIPCSAWVDYEVEE